MTKDMENYDYIEKIYNEANKSSYDLVVGSLANSTLTKEEQEWTKVICCDGKKGGAHKKRWETLINEIRTTNKINENFVSNYFDKKIVVKSDNNICNYKESLIKLKKILQMKKH